MFAHIFLNHDRRLVVQNFFNSLLHYLGLSYIFYLRYDGQGKVGRMILWSCSDHNPVWSPQNSAIVSTSYSVQYLMDALYNIILKELNPPLFAEHYALALLTFSMS